MCLFFHIVGQLRRFLSGPPWAAKDCTWFKQPYCNSARPFCPWREYARNVVARSPSISASTSSPKNTSKKVAVNFDGQLDDVTVRSVCDGKHGTRRWWDEGDLNVSDNLYFLQRWFLGVKRSQVCECDDFQRFPCCHRRRASQLRQEMMNMSFKGGLAMTTSGGPEPPPHSSISLDILDHSIPILFCIRLIHPRVSSWSTYLLGFG